MIYEINRLSAAAVVPGVVLDDAKDAVATAKALLAGGVDVMEITSSAAQGLSFRLALTKRSSAGA